MVKTFTHNTGSLIQSKYFLCCTLMYLMFRCYFLALGAGATPAWPGAWPPAPGQRPGRHAAGARDGEETRGAQQTHRRREPAAGAGAAVTQGLPGPRGVHQPTHRRILHTVQHLHSIDRPPHRHTGFICLMWTWMRLQQKCVKLILKIFKIALILNHFLPLC